MKKKLLSLLMVGAMSVSMLAGCGAGTEEDNNTTQGGGSNQTTKFEETQKIKLYQMQMYKVDATDVQKEINKIAKDKINVEVELNQLDIGSYIQQLPLMMSSGEKFDLVMCTAIPTCGFTMMQAQGQLMDITTYVEEYASGAKEIVKDYLPSTTVGGKVYALPCYRQYNSRIYLMMRKDILDKLELTDKASKATTWAEIEEVFDKVNQNLNTLPEDMKVSCVFGATNNQGSMLTVGSALLGADKFEDNIGFDALGDNLMYLYTDSETKKVENMFTQPLYQKAIERLNTWYDKGWVYKNALTDKDNCGDAGAKTNVYFSYLSTGEYGQEAVKAAEIGKEFVCLPICEIPVTTQTGRQWSWAVPATSENPEAAVAFLNLMYTEPAIENLLVYGIEGQDYDVVDGEACPRENAKYSSSDFFYGNQFNALPKKGNGKDFREKALADMKAAPVSKFYGLVVDTTPVADTVTQINTVLQKYQLPMEAGQLKFAENNPTLLKEIEAAGMSTVLEYYQKQVDEFMK